MCVNVLLIFPPHVHAYKVRKVFLRKYGIHTHGADGPFFFAFGVRVFLYLQTFLTKRFLFQSNVK